MWRIFVCCAVVGFSVQSCFSACFRTGASDILFASITYLHRKRSRSRLPSYDVAYYLSCWLCCRLCCVDRGPGPLTLRMQDTALSWCTLVIRVCRHLCNVGHWIVSHLCVVVHSSVPSCTRHSCTVVYSSARSLSDFGCFTPNHNCLLRIWRLILLFVKSVLWNRDC